MVKNIIDIINSLGQTTVFRSFGGADSSQISQAAEVLSSLVIL